MRSNRQMMDADRGPTAYSHICSDQTLVARREMRETKSNHPN